MCSVLLKKGHKVRKALFNLYNEIDFSKGEVVRILEVSQFIKLIMDDKQVEKVNNIFEKECIVEVIKDLAEISLIYPSEVANTPGIFAALSGELALSDISIVDGVIVGDEHIFIVKEKELIKAMKAMERIRMWGEKVK